MSKTTTTPGRAPAEQNGSKTGDCRAVGSKECDVQLIDVGKSFGTFKAVDSISFSIRTGEFFSLLGPSGCGKTTTLRIIAGFQFPDSGQVFIGGNLMGKTPAHARDTNMVFQQLALFPHMNVFDNVAFGLVMKNVGKEEIKSRVDETLALVELTGLEARRTRQLSGGQQQRVAIARAIINSPRVLLLDEPLGALDLKLRLQMQLELKKLQRNLNTTFVYVTHDQGEALTMSDTIAVMDKGKLIQVGTPGDIYERPRTKFVAYFIGDTNMLTGRVIGLEGDGSVVEVNGLKIQAMAPPGLSMGQEVSLSVRYERIGLGDLARGLENAFTGRVTDMVYIGSTIRYEIALNESLTVLAQLPNTDHVMPISRGDTLQLGWSKESSILLTE